ncbi:hypothetical protein SAMN02910456_01334 [Ruminococcaceae bacterium YRB3002]|nr:hypothetical protein SAMN02910456_01334 [Ruminococcaceae bacterium YRB3002]
MDNFKEAIEYADAAFANSKFFLVVCISFLILAFVVRHTQDRTRRKCGNVLLVSAVPSILMYAACLGAGFYTAVVCYRGLEAGALCAGDVDEGNRLMGLCNGVPIDCMFFSLFIFPVTAVIAIVCGVIIIRKDAGKKTGIASIIYGAALIGYTIWLLFALFATFAG